MKTIAASILGIENKTKLINNLLKKGVDLIHYDLMESDFVSNTSLSIKEIQLIVSNTNKHYVDIHLMVNKPEKHIEQLIDIADHISIHFESQYETSIDEILEKYKNYNKIGLVINPETPVVFIEKYIRKIHHLMFMSVTPGKGGQTFIESTISKIQNIKKLNKNLLLEIDGGINDIWGPKVFKEGITIAVSGSYLVNNIDDNSVKKILG